MASPTPPAPPAGGLQTRSSLAGDLRALGVPTGAVVLVHASLSSLGWVCGGAVAVVQALLDTVGAAGTLVVPTQTGDGSDPSTWVNPPVPEAWWPVIRDEQPGFHPRVTPGSGMGVVAETVRTWPGSRRSDHPLLSFAAVGREAEAITGRHPLTDGLGDRSPLGKVAELGGHILLLGVGHVSSTALHLAEHRTPGAAPMTDFSAATQVGGGRRRLHWRDLDVNSADFPALGAAFELTGAVRVAAVGDAESRLMGVVPAVAFGQRWLTEHRLARRAGHRAAP